MMSFRAVVVIGPTASGKTAIAHRICESVREKSRVCELVNLDAFQFYRGLSIGTAKPSQREIDEYCYHCVDILNPEDRFDAQEYARQAHAACEDIAARGGVPVCVGGSGLYLRAFLHGLDELPEADAGLRNFIRMRAKKEGWAGLHRWLQAIDAERAQEIHPNDSVRIERALEIFFLTGKPPSQAYKRTGALREQNSLFPAFVIHVDAPDAVLRARIESRTSQMLRTGWQEEVEGIVKKYGPNCESFQSMKAIGYRDIVAHMQRPSETIQSLETNIAVRTWQYARRQRTWNAKEVRDAGYAAGDAFEPLWDQVWQWCETC